jgi:hypothetical protein
MACIVVGAQVMAYLVKKYPNEATDADEAVAREIERQRAQGVHIPEPTKQVA